MRTLPAVLTAAALVTLAPPPVQAQPPTSSAADHPTVRDLVDRRGDVRQVSGPGEVDRRPGRREGDLTRLHVRHGERTVTVRLRFAALSRPADAGTLFATATLRTPGGDFTTGVTAVRSDPQGQTWIEHGGDFTCPGLTHRVRYGRDQVTLRVPRTCLGDPDWVRDGADALTGRADTVHADSMPGADLGSMRTGPRAWAPAA